MVPPPREYPEIQIRAKRISATGEPLAYKVCAHRRGLATVCVRVFRCCCVVHVLSLQVRFAPFPVWPAQVVCIYSATLKTDVPKKTLRRAPLPVPKWVRGRCRGLLVGMASSSAAAAAAVPGAGVGGADVCVSAASAVAASAGHLCATGRCLAEVTMRVPHAARTCRS